MSAPTPPPAAPSLLLPFQFHHLPVRGRLLRLEGLSTHVASLREPGEAAQTLAELLAAAALLAHDTKHQLSVGLQLQHPELGALLFAQCLTGDPVQGAAQSAGLRGYANEAARATPFSQLSTTPGGIFAVTLENPTQPESQRYQSFVGLNGSSAAACLAEYFAASVQTPTHFVVMAQPNGTCDTATALMLQALPGEEPVKEDDWARLKMLLETLKPAELLSPVTDLHDWAEELLAKLFAEDDVSTFEPEHPTFAHDDPRPRMLAALAALPPEDLAELQRQPSVTLTDATSGVEVTFSAEELAHLGANTAENAGKQ